MFFPCKKTLKTFRNKCPTQTDICLIQTMTTSLMNDRRKHRRSYMFGHQISISTIILSTNKHDAVEMRVRFPQLSKFPKDARICAYLDQSYHGDDKLKNDAICLQHLRIMARVQDITQYNSPFHRRIFEFQSIFIS